MDSTPVTADTRADRRRWRRVRWAWLSVLALGLLALSGDLWPQPMPNALGTLALILPFALLYALVVAVVATLEAGLWPWLRRWWRAHF